MEAERVWLVHRDGFAPAGLLKNDKDNNKNNEDNEDDIGEGKVRVQLDYNGDIIEVKTVPLRCISFIHLNYILRGHYFFVYHHH